VNTPEHRTRVVFLERQPFPHTFSIERVFEQVRAHLPARFECEVVVSSFPSTGVRNRVRSVLEARRHRGDVVHVAGDTNYLGLLGDRRRTVLTVHDTEFLERAGAVKRLLYRAFWLRLPVRRSAVVTTPSSQSRADLLREVRCPPAKVRVVPNPLPDLQPAPRRRLPERPVLLQVGTRPNKNLARVVEALAGIPCILRVMGPLSAADRRSLEERGVQYEEVLGVGDDEVERCYRDCDVLLFVSTKEGFGMPVIEAQAVGRPVVTSDVQPLREVAGEGACFVDPYDVSAIRSGIERVLSDEGYREELVQRGLRNVDRFRPELVAAQYAAIYDEIVARAS
jgi:glycosyltransferase involved in cell wall biosynthesis